MPSIFNDSGITTKTIGEFRQGMVDSAKVAFADKLDGRELRADDSSVLGRLFAIISKPLAQNEEILPLILQSMDMNSAEGQQLDNILWNLHRIKRKGESQSTGLAILYGDIGTYIAVGSEVANSLTGDTYKTDSNIELGTNFVTGVDVRVESLTGTTKISYSIEGLLSQSSAIVTELSSRDDTTRKVADRVVDSINSQSSYLIATRNNDNTVRILVKEQFRVANFSVSDTLTILRSYAPVYITSTTYKSRESTVGQVNTIRTSTMGWRGVHNPFYIRPSQGVESDEDYRYRGKLKQTNGFGKYSSILMAIKSVRGVVYENIQQNTSSNPTNSGIINNGVAITVMGGNEDDIAYAIFNSVSEGIMTSGDILKMVKDVNGFEHEIRFSRPILVPLQISMSLVTYPNFPINGNSNIRQAIVEWFNNLDVGEDIHYSRLYEPVNSIQGFAVKNLKFGYKGGTLSAEDIIIRHNEIATLNAEDIIIGGSRGSKNIVNTTPTPETPPEQIPCVSSGVVRFSSDLVPASGTARYRVNNGEWVDFSGSWDDSGESILIRLFEHINVTNGSPIFYTGMDLPEQDYAFYSPDGERLLISGEEVISEDNYYQFSVGEKVTNTVEFETTTGDNGDLVEFMFGGNKTLKSCVLAKWAGR